MFLLEQVTLLSGSLSNASRQSGNRRFLLLAFCALCLSLLFPSLTASGQQTPPVSAIQTTQTLHPADFVPKVPPRAIAYQRSARVLSFVSMGWSFFGLWLFLKTHTFAKIRDRVLKWCKIEIQSSTKTPKFRAVVLFYLIYMLLMNLWHQPVGLAGFALEHYFGFARQSLGLYAKDGLLSIALGLIITPLMWGGFWLVERSPRRWWLWLWLPLIPLLFVQMVLQPVVLAPAYNRFTPLAEGPLKEKLLALASKAGIHGGNVYVTDTSRRSRHVNAYVTGLGPTTRIVLNDTALELLPEDQILAMMGHEMGHYVEGHIWVGLVSSIVGSGVFLFALSRLLPWLVARKGQRWGVTGTNDLAVLPIVLLLLSLFMLLQSPVESFESRILERRADAFGLRMTGLNAATARLMVGFAERDFSDPDPPLLLHIWFGSHPTLKERIAFALHYKQ